MSIQPPSSFQQYNTCLPALHDSVQRWEMMMPGESESLPTLLSPLTRGRRSLSLLRVDRLLPPQPPFFRLLSLLPGEVFFFWLRHPAAISRDFWVVLRMLVFLPPSLRYTQYSLEGWVTQRVGMKERRRSPFHPLNGAGAIFFLTFPSSFDERTHKEERNIAYDK